MKYKIFVYSLLFVLFRINCNSHKILILSIPKCGTHLAAKAAELLTGKKLAKEVLPDRILKNGLSVITNPANIFRCHLMYNQKLKEDLLRNNFKILFIYRDPRDQIISSAYWIKEVLKNNNKLQNFTSEQLIDLLIKRLPLEKILQYNTANKQKINITNFNFHSLLDDIILRVNDYFSFFMKWKNEKNVYSVKFENLVGKYGNGNDVLQKKEIKKISNFLGLNSDALINHCIKNLYGGTFTFREGKIGSWKKEFTQKQINSFKNIAGKLLIDLGYEKNLNW